MTDLDRALAALDRLDAVIGAQPVTITEDLPGTDWATWARVVVAGWRDVLTDHQYLRADVLGKPRYECVRDMEWWPCPDVERVFDGLKAAGVWDD